MEKNQLKRDNHYLEESMSPEEKRRRTRIREIERIKKQYIDHLLLRSKKLSIVPEYYVVWQAGRSNEDNSDQSEQIEGENSKDIIIGYLLKANNGATIDYIFHYSNSGLLRARQLDRLKKYNSFFNSFLYKRGFKNENSIYISRGGVHPIFFEKIDAMQQRRAEIIAEAKRKNKSIFEVATKNINDDFFMIEPNEANIAEINRRYKGTTKEIQDKMAEDFSKDKKPKKGKDSIIENKTIHHESVSIKDDQQQQPTTKEPETNEEIEI